ncbi:MAG: nonstructural protein [Microvirus sp.]|nr:MAG: nonstructural protein [Microvirus sp.]
MQKLYIVYDKVAETIVGNIIQCPNDAPAIRLFHDALKGETQLSLHPADYELVLIGSILETGFMEATIPTSVATGAQWEVSNATPQS